MKTSTGCISPFYTRPGSEFWVLLPLSFQLLLCCRSSSERTNGGAVAAECRRSEVAVESTVGPRRSVDSRGNASVDDKQYITIDLVRIVNTTHS